MNTEARNSWQAEYVKKLGGHPYDVPANIVGYVSILCFLLRRNGVKNPNVVETYIFREVLEYDAIRDRRGKSDISLDDYEPDQIVFLLPQAFKVVDTIIL